MQQIRRIVKGLRVEGSAGSGRGTGTTATSVLVGGNGGVRSPATTPRAKSEIRSAAGKHMESVGKGSRQHIVGMKPGQTRPDQARPDQGKGSRDGQLNVWLWFQVPPLN